jgi:hypothetical protein
LRHRLQHASGIVGRFRDHKEQHHGGGRGGRNAYRRPEKPTPRNAAGRWQCGAIFGQIGLNRKSAAGLHAERAAGTDPFLVCRHPHECTLAVGARLKVRQYQIAFIRRQEATEKIQAAIFCQV